MPHNKIGVKESTEQFKRKVIYKEVHHKTQTMVNKRCLVIKNLAIIIFVLTFCFQKFKNHQIAKLYFFQLKQNNMHLSSSF